MQILIKASMPSQPLRWEGVAEDLYFRTKARAEWAMSGTCVKGACNYRLVSSQQPAVRRHRLLCYCSFALRNWKVFFSAKTKECPCHTNLHAPPPAAVHTSNQRNYHRLCVLRRYIVSCLHPQVYVNYSKSYFRHLLVPNWWWVCLLSAA